MPTPDPLQYGVVLPLRETFYPLGFTLEIETNSPSVLEAARESWPCGSALFAERPLRLCIAVSPGPKRDLPPPPAFRGQAHLVSIISDQRNFAVCDYQRGFGFCCLESAAVADRPWLRYCFLEAVTYLLLTQLYLTPLHAACVALEGRGVLLLGESGAGKSCLAYACACRGWTYLADDASSLVRGHAGRMVLGRPHQIRFRDSAPALFPELAGRPAVYGVNGKRSIEVPTREMPHIATASSCRADYIVFLHRGDGAARLDPISASMAQGRLEEVLFLYDAQVYAGHRSSLAELASAQAFDLRYQESERAADLLRALVLEGDLP